MAEPTFTRSGAAARKATTPPTTRAPRRAPSRTTPRATSHDAGRKVRAGQIDELAVRLAVALGELDDDVRRAVLSYRSAGLTDEQWAQAADLVRLGLATYQPKSRQAV